MKKRVETVQKDTQAKGWLITASAAKVSREELEEALSGYAGVVGQLEEGDQKDENGQGYRHWQLYLEHTSPIRFSTLKRKLPTAHLDVRKGPKSAAFAYCTKSATRVEGEPPVKIGEIDLEDQKGHRSDLEEIRRAILEDNATFDEVVLGFPSGARHARMVRELIGARDRQRLQRKERNVVAEYWWGAPGVGKTRRVFEETNGLEDTYRVTSYVNPFDTYAGESTLVLDEFAGQIKLEVLLNLLDRYPMVLPARYADKQAAFTRVIIISNLEPWTLYRDAEQSRRMALARRLMRVEHMTSGMLVGNVEVIAPSAVARGFAVTGRDQQPQATGWGEENSWTSADPYLEEPPF